MSIHLAADLGEATITIYILGLVTLPVLALVSVAIALTVERTNTFALRCGCGVDFGNPRERGWTRWWMAVRMFAHDRSRHHRDFVARGDR